MEQKREKAGDDIVVDFGFIPMDELVEKVVSIENITNKSVSYRLSAAYSVNNIDRVFKACFIRSGPIDPGSFAVIKTTFRPNIPGQSFADHYIIDDTTGYTYLLTVKGKCKGPKVYLNKNKVVFFIHKNKSEQRKREIRIINDSSIDAHYQWFLPQNGVGDFQISTGNCGLIKAFESITCSITFSGISLGTYTEELVCLVVNQEPLYLYVIASVVLLEEQTFYLKAHSFDKRFKRHNRHLLLMENSLQRLSYIPMASVYDRYLDFGLGSETDMTKNVSQTLCVTNHEEVEGYIQWSPDPENIFIVDPIALRVPPKESRLFTVRFRPKMKDQVYGCLMCGEYQQKNTDETSGSKTKHKWFRVPCIGNTWSRCFNSKTDFYYPSNITFPPTVPARVTFMNFKLSNNLSTVMSFKFLPPTDTNFVIMPVCGIVTGRSWQVITVAFEPQEADDFIEHWEIMINERQKVRITFTGKAELSQLEFMSNGYNPTTDAMYELKPTVTGTVSNVSAYIHNQSRMHVHMRVLNYVPWLGAESCGSIVLPPREVVQFRWWFFPTRPNKVYNTVVICSCVCLIDGKCVGDVTDFFIQIIGFSERAQLKTLPRNKNLHDIVVGEKVNFNFIIYNSCSCKFTSKLIYLRSGMEDDYSNDVFETESKINILKPSTHSEVKCTVIPYGVGPRQILIRFSILFLNENDEQIEITPVHKVIFSIWYDGIYPTMQVKRTIASNCPVILSNHCLWNLMNIQELNKALQDCRPKIPVTVNLYAPELCVDSDPVELVLVLGCVYAAPVDWALRREKICECPMVEVQLGISLFEMRHDACPHRQLVELTPLEGTVTKKEPALLYMELNYALENENILCYELKMSHERTLFLKIHIMAHGSSKSVLTGLRRHVEMPQYLAVMDCGRVPINNFDPVIRMVWLYNPTTTSVTWRLLLPRNPMEKGPLRCLLHFAAVSPLGRLGIPISFLPTEMIDYETELLCAYGNKTMKILVKGQGGLPNCVETRLDIPYYTEKLYRAVYRSNVVYLSTEHITIPELTTHSLWRDLLAINNDTDHAMRFIWLPERVPNIVNIVMTPCWGVVMPKSTHWITMSVYTLQEPVIFTTTVACELLDLTLRKQCRDNEVLRRQKVDQCRHEFIITEEGTSYKDINDCPPYVLNLKRPQPSYLALSVAISSKGQRDGYTRMNMKQQWEQTPPYDLLFTEINDTYNPENTVPGNNLSKADVIRIIDGILWDALHSKMFKYQLEYYSKEEIPTYSQLLNAQTEKRPHLSRRVTSGICDAIVNKAVFRTYGLNQKQEVSILEAE